MPTIGGCIMALFQKSLSELRSAFVLGRFDEKHIHLGRDVETWFASQIGSKRPDIRRWQQIVDEIEIHLLAETETSANLLESTCVPLTGTPKEGEYLGTFYEVLQKLYPLLAGLIAGNTKIYCGY